MSNRYMKSVPISLNNPSVEKSQDLRADYGRCLAVCSEEIGVTRQWAGKSADIFSCIHCEQCAAVCPERAIRDKSRWREVIRTINDPQKIVIFSTVPSVRMGLGECFGGRSEDFMEGRMVSILRKLGVDHVLNAAFSADLTIMGEGVEFLRRFLTGSHPLPQFTSCCPAWIKYVETFHPERIGCLSSAKSPISMQGTLIKTYFARGRGIDPGRIVSVAVAPYTAKKFKISREELCSSGIYQGIPGLMDNDHVLTAKELAEWITESGIEFYGLDPPSFDLLMGEGNGAGMTFGNTGGVMETALRMAYSVVSRKEPMDLLLKYRSVRGLNQVKETVVSLRGQDVRAAVIYGTRVARQLIGTGNIDSYDFVEVMICLGGCISSGGQSDSGVLPVPNRLGMERIKSPYRVDEQKMVGSSLDNRGIKHLYERFPREPMGELAQTLLYTCYHSRKDGKQTRDNLRYAKRCNIWIKSACISNSANI